MNEETRYQKAIDRLAWYMHMSIVCCAGTSEHTSYLDNLVAGSAIVHILSGKSYAEVDADVTATFDKCYRER